MLNFEYSVDYCLKWAVVENHQTQVTSAPTRADGSDMELAALHAVSNEDGCRDIMAQYGSNRMFCRRSSSAALGSGRFETMSSLKPCADMATCFLCEF